MALNKNERLALEFAREQIAQAGGYYICNQLDEAAEAGVCAWEEARRLQAYIHRALEFKASLDGWQLHKELGYRSVEQRCADRLAWIDWMLDQPVIKE